MLLKFDFAIVVGALVAYVKLKLKFVYFVLLSLEAVLSPTYLGT